MKKILCVAFLCLVLSAPAIAEVPWQPIQDKNDTRTYMRNLPGTDIKEFRAITIVEAKLEEIAALLRDIDGYPRWLPQCRESILLEQKDYFSFVIYEKFDLPWPLWDRDVILTNSVDIDISTGRATAKFWAIPRPGISEKKRHVRLSTLQGEFLFEYIGRDATRVMLTYRLDSGGAVPLKIANIVIRRMPYMTLQRMKKMVKKEKYIKLAKVSEEKKMVDELLGDRKTVETAMRNRLMEYFQYEDLAQIIIKDKAFVDRLLTGDMTFDDIRERTVEIIRVALQAADVGKYIRDSEIAGRLAAEPKLVKALMKDRLVTDMILDGSGTFEEIIVDRARRL